MSVFRRAVERRGTSASALVVGVGNPGSQYEGTRHNVGFEVIDLLAARHGGSLKLERRERAAAGTIRWNDAMVALARPTTFMNLSGESVGPLVKRYGIDDPSNVIVVQDELDLEPGRIKIKIGGSSAGHNGLKSISQHLGTDDYIRVRVGVGKPPHPRAGKDWVLKKPGKADREKLDDSVHRAADAIEAILSTDAATAMNDFNRA
ncbi:MAG: PTH1 family peptidyl-tRNA hydrolase [Candidatus Poriferisodalaceae bacterium]|jgi:PTH1 family peptidyl-tRNA hydrolase